MPQKIIKKIADRIAESKSFLITAHINLEGDALGSELAAYLLLKKLKKKAVICNNDRTPVIYQFFPSVGVIKNSVQEKRFDTALVLDCSDSSRAGKIKDSLSKADCVINIDHHIGNTCFGDINWVQPRASSASEMFYRVCEKFKIMDKNIAFCLYTGIFTDTGSFVYSNTSEATHKIVSNLMKYDIHPNKIYNNLYSLCQPRDLNFIGKVMSSLKFSPDKKICWAVMAKIDERPYDLSEVVFSIMRRLKSPEVFLLFKKVNSGRTRVNFRSRSYIDVNEIAKFFGGGGHKKASGTTVEESIDKVENKVIGFVRKYIK
ncbi:MAG: bifunctional oligoribonuclease/PAP phosphatase NrnA [Candidatus Omnitrophota bacterium]